MDMYMYACMHVKRFTCTHIMYQYVDDDRTVGYQLESNGRGVADLDDWSISTCYANAPIRLTLSTERQRAASSILVRVQPASKPRSS